MAKRKVIRKSNRLFTYSPNYYNWGGDFKNALGGVKPFDLKGTFSGGNVAGMLKEGLASDIGSAVGNIAGGAIGGGLESGAGSAISNIGGTIGGAVSAVNPVLGGIISVGTGIIGGLTNRMFGSKLNKEKIAEVEGSNKAINTVMVDNSSADSVMDQWANQDFGKDFTKSDIGKDGWFSNKAKNKYKELKRQQDIARNRALASYENAAEAADTQSDLNAMANFAAFGGPLGIWGGYGSGAIGYELAKENLGIKALNAANKGRITSLPNSFESPELNTFADGGKIYIKPENRGKFTVLKERTGKSATWFKEHGTPAQKKMATFALNSRKWKHDDGGPLDSLVADINRRSKADFVQRLLDSNRDYIQDWESDNIATHKLGWATDDKGAIVFPNVQRINGKLYDFTDPKNKRKKWDALDSAIERGDTLRMTPAQAEEFTKTYKKYYPKGKTFKAFGGDLLTHGAEWDNGVTVIGNGDTHENNPYEGVQMGVDNQGIPNLVEEGEVVFNDYVFSNRLKVPDAVRNKYRLRGNKELTFADVAKQMQKESEERPNDPISKRGLLSSMSRLQQAQETVRQQAQEGQEGTQYAHGGRMGTLFDGLGQYPNHLLTIDDDSVPEGTMFDPISNRYIFTGYQDSDAKPLNFGSGITPSGEWVEEPKYMARAAAKRAGYDVGSSLDDYNKNPIKVPEKKKSAVSRLLSNLDATDLRYAPVIGAAIGLGQNLFSRPDYTSADAILEAANQAGNYTPIGYTPIGNYLQYRPFDRNFYLNKLNAQAGATRRAIMNTTSPSRNAALLAADYNAQGRLGDLARQAEEYNLAQKQAVETFNRGTNMANAEMGLKAAMANQEAALKARSSRLSGVAQAMAVRDAVDARRGASMSANLTNLFDSLGNIGIDAYNREDRDKLIRAGVFGTLSEKPQEWSDKTWKEYKDYINKSLENKTPKVKGKQHSKGGYLTIKKGKQHGKL